MGTTHYLVASIDVGEVHVSFRFEEAGKAGAAGGAMKLVLETAAEESTFEWSDAPSSGCAGAPSASMNGRWSGRRRELQQREEAAERKRLEAIAAEQQRVRDRRHRLAANLRKARERSASWWLSWSSAQQGIAVRRF